MADDEIIIHVRHDPNPPEIDWLKARFLYQIGNVRYYAMTAETSPSITWSAAIEAIPPADGEDA